MKIVKFLLFGLGGLAIIILAFAVIRPELLNKFRQGRSGSEPEYVQGQIMMTFKEGVTEEQALSLLKKYNLKPSGNFFKYLYVPIYSKDESLLGEYRDKLRKYSIVQRAEVVGSVGQWLVVDFVSPVGQAEIEELIKPFVALYVKEDFYLSGIQTASVPIGKETYFADLLMKEPIIKYSSVNSIARVLY